MSSYLYYNASIWSWNTNDLSVPLHPYPGSVNDSNESWVVVKDGQIIDIGSSNPPLVNEYTDKIDCHGGLLLPGLIDAHIHVAMTGESQYFLDLSDCRSIFDLQRALDDHLKKHQDIYWIQGVNWDQSKLGGYPTRHDIDSICSDKPIFLWRACWHIGVANTKALNLANIDISCLTRVIEGGSIDIKDNEVSGILKERAVELISSVMGMKTKEEKRRFILIGLNLCIAKGLTSVQTNDDTSYNIYSSLRDEHQLNIRVFLTPNHGELMRDRSMDGIAEIEPFNYLSHRQYNLDSPMTYLSMDRVKIYSDGSLGAETAAIRNITTSEDNNNNNNNNNNSNSNNTSNGSESSSKSYKGILVQSAEVMQDMVKLSKEKGYRLEIHAIGDAAAEQVVSSLEKCNITPEDRPIITHCQVLGPDIIERMKIGGIIANVQPSFVPTDMLWVRQRISEKQQLSSYAWKTLLLNNVHVAGGSDSPIETCSPLIGMYDAIFRHGRGDQCNDVFRPEECLSFSEALWIYTAGAAYASGCEKILGAIQIGYAADMILIDPQIVTNPKLLASTTPRMVISGGKVVYTNTNISSVVDIDITNGGDERGLMKGPFIPGKGGGLRRRTQSAWMPNEYSCSCSLLGRPCDMVLRSNIDKDL